MKLVRFIIFAIYILCLPCKVTVRKRRSIPNITKKCYDELGCLCTNKAWFHPENRPENPLPADRHTVKTQFVYYTRDRSSKNDTSKGQIVPAKMEFIRDSGFKCNYPTLIFIHDFTSHGWAGWIKKTVQGVLGIMNWNIYSVDWEFGARPPYAQAVSNARVVALEIMYLLKILQSDFKVDMKDVHIIGHGVGAHIAGYVGGNIRGLGKITALDPSGPYFHGMPACTRLDITDACIVQVIHTDTFCTKGETGQGIPEPLGHYDFYPNAGYNQPGCEENVEYPSLLKVTEDNLPPGNILPGCSHKRALKYMKEALLNPECPMMGFRCRNKEAFLNGQCTTCGENSVNCVPFHILNNKYPKPELGTRYFFKTNSSSPFCLYPYSIALELTVPDQVSDMLEGTVSIKLQQNKEMIELDFVNTWPQKFEQGGIKSLLGYNSAPKFSEVDHCEVTWQGVGSFFHKASSVLRITAVYVTSLGSYPPSNMSTKLCSCHNKDHTEIASGQSAVFVKCSTVPTFDVRSSLN